MKLESKNQIDLVVLQNAVAFLLARDAVKSGIPLKELQNILADEFVHQCQAVASESPKDALAVEVQLMNSLDMLFSTAGGMSRAMQG